MQKVKLMRKRVIAKSTPRIHFRNSNLWFINMNKILLVVESS